jgi:hypothetical protein
MAIFKYEKPKDSTPKVEPKLEKEPDTWDKIVAKSKSESQDITDGYKPKQSLSYIPVTLQIGDDPTSNPIEEFNNRLVRYLKDSDIECKINTHSLIISLDKYLKKLERSGPIKPDYTKLPEIIKPEFKIVKRHK